MLSSLLPINHDFLRRHDTRWWTVVYFCLHGLRDHIWWELLDSFHDNGHPDPIQLIDVTWVDVVDPNSWCRYCRLVTLLVYNNVLRSSTETHSEISSYTDSAWTEGGMTPASDEIVTNPASANELCFLQIHDSLCMTKDEFVWLWMGSQESKGVYKLVPVVSQIFLLTVTQLFYPSLTSRSQVTLSMVTLLLISQWLRHLFRWGNASASDYCALFLFFDWRSSVTKPIEDCTRSYAFMQRFNWQISLWVYHPNTTTFRWCGSEVSRADEVGQLACPPEFVQIQENPVLLWVSQEFFLSQVFIPEFFLSQVFIPEFSSLRFSLPVRLLILLKMMLCSTALSRVSVTEHWRKKTRRRVNCLSWLDSFLLRQVEHSSRSFDRSNMVTLQTSLEKVLYTTGVSDAWVIPTTTRKFIRIRKLTDKSTSLWSMPTLWVRDTAEFISFFWTRFLMGQNFDLLSRHVFVCIAFYECVDKVLSWAKARVTTSRRYLWPGYWR
jgi:hypothetical protein